MEESGGLKEKRLCSRSVGEELQANIPPSPVPSQYHHPLFQWVGSYLSGGRSMSDYS